jgi:hypothetical protein
MYVDRWHTAAMSTIRSALAQAVYFVAYTYVPNAVCQDLHHVLMGDVINDMMGCHLPVESGGMDLVPESKKHAVLACGDRSIYIVRGSAKAYNVALQSVPTVLCAFDPDARAYAILTLLFLLFRSLILASKAMRTEKFCTARRVARLACCSWPSTHSKAFGLSPTTSDLAVRL